MQVANFAVDAALLQELGERLIGQSHIALAELVKNAYDADAHVCRIEFGEDEIVVSDDGHGISEQEFHSFWMRIGTTHKVDQRTSRCLQRPMTGSKGLGRLSAQFLAHETVLQSTSQTRPSNMLYAIVDWRNIRSGTDVHTVDVAWEMRDESATYADGSTTGTTVRLKGLRSSWDRDAIEDLGKMVWMLRPPLRYANRQALKKTASDFYVDVAAPALGAVQESFDARQRALLGDWKARISGVLEDGRRAKPPHAAVTVEFKAGYPDGLEAAKIVQETVAVPIERLSDRAEPAIDRARFEILVFKNVGRQASGIPVGDVRDYLRKFGGVSLYDAGFRLPYYGSSDLGGRDWLKITEDQARRLTTSKLLPNYLNTEGRYMLDLPNPGRIFGAVEVDTNHEHGVAQNPEDPNDWLRIQPGRDRLAHNRAFEQLRDLVRFAVDLYANRYRAFADQVAETARVKDPPRQALERAISALDRHREAIPDLVFHDIKQDVARLERAVEKEEEFLDRRAVLLAPLATAGMAALAFNHELARETRTLREIKRHLSALAATRDDSADINRAIQGIADFEARFKSYRALFSPLAKAEDKEPRRLRVFAVLEQLVKSLRPRMPGVTFHFRGQVDRDLRFPTGSFVEWSALLQNVLFNAWNAMLGSQWKHVRLQTTEPERRRVSLRISDTGVGLAVTPAQSSPLFEPFERRMVIAEENRSLAIGGEGLGLAIVKMIAERRLAEVSFVEPSHGYSTAFELSWRAS